MNKDYVIESGKIHAFTDGACSGNPGPMGIGIVYLYIDDIGSEITKEVSENIGHGTNNIAELTAIKKALEGINNRDIETIIHTDSMYSIGAITGLNKVKANATIIEGIRGLIACFRSVGFKHIKGHNGNKYNERADRLATSCL